MVLSVEQWLARLESMTGFYDLEFSGMVLVTLSTLTPHAKKIQLANAMNAYARFVIRHEIIA